METTYHKLRKIVDESKCRNCGGLGEVDDAEPGDICCNTWICGECHGTGLSKSIQQITTSLSSLNSVG